MADPMASTPDLASGDQTDKRRAAVRLTIEQMRALYSQSVPALLASPVIGVIVAAVLWQAKGGPGLVAFPAILFVLSGYRFGLVRAFRRAAAPEVDYRRWLNRYLAVVGAVSLTWGIGSVALYVPGDPLLQVFLAFTVGGMTAGAVTTNAYYLPAFYVFAGPSVLPLATRLLIDFDRVHISMSAMLTVFVTMLVIIARNLNRSHQQELRLRDELIESRDAAEAGTRAKAEFLSVVTHELRTPMTSVRGALGLLDAGNVGKLSDEGARLVDIALRNAERLGDLIDDILDAEGLESGQLELRVKKQPLVPLVRQAVEGNREFAAQFNVGIRLRGDELEFDVNVDGRRLVQVLTNLLSNAAKFSPDGGQVDVCIARCQPGVRVSVTDRGPGIPAEFHGRLFDKFAQGDSSDSRSAGGTGLGLNISRSIVERLGGNIGFESNLGRGSTFHVDLPIAASA